MSINGLHYNLSGLIFESVEEIIKLLISLRLGVQLSPIGLSMSELLLVCPYLNSVHDFELDFSVLNKLVCLVRVGLLALSLSKHQLHRLGLGIELLKELEELLRALYQLNWVLVLDLLHQLGRDLCCQVVHNISAHLIELDLIVDLGQMLLQSLELIEHLFLLDNSLGMMSLLIRLLLLYSQVQQLDFGLNLLLQFIAAPFHAVDHELELNQSVFWVDFLLTLGFAFSAVAHFIDYKLYGVRLSLGLRRVYWKACPGEARSGGKVEG